MSAPIREVIGDATLYCADCRDVLPSLTGTDAVITDPPWDGAEEIPGADDPRGLFRSVAPLLRAKRYVIQLGCDSDPAFLAPIAQRHPFLRVCWLAYACPTYKGRLLHTGDVAYAYGEWPAPHPGATVIPGECRSSRADREFVRGPRSRGKEKGGYTSLSHPMPRRSEHVAWLVRWFAQGAVLDPFMGSGTTGVCAVQQGRPFIGIDVHRPYFDLACRRIDDAQRQRRLIA